MKKQDFMDKAIIMILLQLLKLYRCHLIEMHFNFKELKDKRLVIVSLVRILISLVILL